METRSVTQYEQNALYEVNIDFDGASEAWRKNKKSKGNGTYVYKCEHICLSGKQCIREALPDCDYCKMHKNKK